MKYSLKTFIRIGEFALLGGLLLFLLNWHLKVGLARFFDVDEFTHLHWAANMAHGERPYIDFFTFFTPGFYWLLAPLFGVFGRSVEIFIAARWFAFAVFAGLVAATGALFAVVRSRRFALLPMALLAFLPMPFDKFMELRPDNVSTLLGLIGILVQSYAMLHPASKKLRVLWLIAGISYAVSLIVLVKTLPFVAVGIGIAALDAGVYRWVVSCFRKKKLQKFMVTKHHRDFLLGFGGIMAAFFVWLLSLGDSSRVWYALMKLPFEANTIGRIYIMEPHLFFFPNASFYGGWGITPALLANHTLWTVGILMGCYRAFTPFITGDGNEKRVLVEVMLSSIFIGSVVGYVMFFPLKHSQYLIPIAVFIALYGADFIVLAYKRMGIAGFAALCAGVWFLAGQANAVNSPKLTMSNAEQLRQTQQLQQIIPADGQVLDLDGRLLFWKDPYDICCLPFGSFVRFLSRPPKPLAEVLEARNVAYIYQGTSGRIWELESDLAYIKERYETVSGWGDALWKRKGNE